MDINMAEMKTTDTIESSSLRVNLELLDNLMNLAGELVLGRNQLLQALSVNDEKTLHLTSQRIDLVTSELQEGIMKTRMQPVANVFNKLPRVIRDTAVAQGKKAELRIEGQEVELDKTIIEAIGNPLYHLARNAVDHGIESIEDRKRMGKSEIGHIHLKAFHEAGQVNIEISDDGRGINPDTVGTVALKKKLIDTAQLDGMSTKDKLQLIFLPGFGARNTNNEKAGQSNEMHLIKNAIEQLGGLIDVVSDQGKSTTFRIKLPLTLAIIPSQIISLAGERYAIPQVNLDELLRIPAGQLKDRIERVGDADVIRLRGKLLPLVRLVDVLGIERHYIDPNDGAIHSDRRMNISDRRGSNLHISDGLEAQSESDHHHTQEQRSGKDRRQDSGENLNVAVVSTGSLTYGLIVDQMHDSEEIVVKPLGRHLSVCDGYAGATIMGDGKVALILDVYNIARLGRLSLVEGRYQRSRLDDKINQGAADSSNLSRWLCFRISDDEHFAIGMEDVQRIERISIDEMEIVGSKRVVQKRGRSLPLISLDEVSNIKPIAERDFIEVITLKIESREIGLMATPPLDAVELKIEIDDSALKQECITGSAIIKGHTTLIVDVAAAAIKTYPEWFHHNAA